MKECLCIGNNEMTMSSYSLGELNNYKRCLYAYKKSFYKRFIQIILNVYILKSLYKALNFFE